MIGGGADRDENDGDGADGPKRAGFAVRRASAGELSAVLGVLDGANLATDAEVIRTAISEGDVLVAEASGESPSTSSPTTGSTLLGALVLVDDEITDVAVRRGRRGQGIGTALVREAAAGDRGRLTAEFDASVRPFYDALGFESEPADEDGRWVGRGPLPGDD